jgi:hypothetical protein
MWPMIKLDLRGHNLLFSVSKYSALQYFLNNSRTQLASDLWFSPIDRELRGTYALRKIKIPPSLEGSVFRQPFKY